jgi:hypothetical protein
MPMRNLDNGYRICDEGEVPIAPEGYEPAFDNPRLFLPKLPACTARKLQIEKSGCCGKAELIYCNGNHVTRLECQQCQKMM